LREIVVARKFKERSKNMYSGQHSLMIGAAGLLIGFCFGIGTGFLMAPQSGARTRRQLKHFTEDMIDDTKEAIEEVIDQGKHLMAVR
jgi:gas vesicle protein